MKTYTIKPEFLSSWGCETTENTIVDETEVKRLAAEWGSSVEDLLEQLDFRADERYEIMTDHFEFRMGPRRDRIPAMSAEEILDTHRSCDYRITSNCLNPTLEASFDTLEEARAEFARNYAYYGCTRLDRSSLGYLLSGSLAWIERNEYDEDGEFDQGGETYDVSAEPYEPETEEE